MCVPAALLEAIWRRASARWHQARASQRRRSLGSPPPQCTGDERRVRFYLLIEVRASVRRRWRTRIWVHPHPPHDPISVRGPYRVDSVCVTLREKAVLLNQDKFKFGDTPSHRCLGGSPPVLRPPGRKEDPGTSLSFPDPVFLSGGCVL